MPLINMILRQRPMVTGTRSRTTTNWQFDSKDYGDVDRNVYKILVTKNGRS